ncbi:hypothetical protein BDF19DRAFT_451721 [Syncephalis fuscata]|nr:hypothetical protein BDF19DRAFT_451721 [Syncephalis fuscata]
MNRTPSPSSSHSIEDLLNTDFIELNALLTHYDELTATLRPSEEYYRHRQQCINELVRLTSIHWFVSETVLLPALEGVLNEDQIAITRRWLVKARTDLLELSEMDVDDAGYLEALNMIRRHLNISHDKEVEWIEMLTSSRNATGLTELADQAMSARALAPTRPHPNLPDGSTTAGKIATTVMASVDRIRDFGREFDRTAHRQSPLPQVG